MIAPGRRTAFLALAATLALPGCAGLIGGGPALDAYDLRAPEPSVQARRESARDLVIEIPNASAALETDRILIRPHPLQAQYLPGARWTGEAPVMLQTLMLRAFEDANAFRFVGRRPLGASADVALVSELTDFQAELGPDDAVSVRVRLTVRLVREADASILASRTFQTTALVSSTEPLAVVEGLNTATDALLPDLVAWALARLGVAVQA